MIRSTDLAILPRASGWGQGPRRQSHVSNGYAGLRPIVEQGSGLDEFDIK
jgi:hypothetical protein